MRALLACAAAVLIMAASTWAADDEKIQVKPYMKAGTYVLSMKMTNSSESDGNRHESRVEMALELKASEPSDGGQKLVIAGKAGHMTASRPDGTEETRENMPDMKFEIIIDGNGDVTKFTDLNPTSGPSRGPSAEEMKKNGRFQVGQLLPHLILATSQPVAVNQSWETANTDESVKAKCKLLKLAKDMAQFEIQVETNREPTPNLKSSNKAKFIIQYDRAIQAAASESVQAESVSEYAPPPGVEGKASKYINKTHQEMTLKPGKYEDASQPASAPVQDKN